MALSKRANGRVLRLREKQRQNKNKNKSVYEIRIEIYIIYKTTARASGNQQQRKKNGRTFLCTRFVVDFAYIGFGWGLVLAMGLFGMDARMEGVRWRGIYRRVKRGERGSGEGGRGQNGVVRTQCDVRFLAPIENAI